MVYCVEQKKNSVTGQRVQERAQGRETSKILCQECALCDFVIVGTTEWTVPGELCVFADHLLLRQLELLDENVFPL